MSAPTIEKRKSKRYEVRDFVLATCGPKLGHVINISEKGLAFKLMDTDVDSLPETCKTSLLTKTKGFLVEELSLKLVRKEVMSSSPTSTIAAKFETSDVIQLCKIKQYIFGLT